MSVVVGLWIPYLAVNTMYPSAEFTYAAGLVVAVASVVVLLLGGIQPPGAGIRLARPGKLTIVVIPATTMLAVIGFALVDRIQPWEWKAILFAAPASAFAQELYFRAALPSALRRGWSLSPRAANVCQAALFAAWHARAFTVVAVPTAVVVVMLAFVVGLAWGTLAARDRTVFWVVSQHCFFLAVQ